MRTTTVSAHGLLPLFHAGTASGAASDGALLLWRIALALALLAVPTAIALALDDRMLGHFNVWIKPLKFQLALAVQTATLAWAVGHLTPVRRRIAMPHMLAIGWAAVALYEASYITLQGARGVASHFNRTTPWEAVGGTLMATGAGLLVTVTLWVGLVALWQARRQRWAPMPLAIGAGFILGALLAGWTGGAIGAVRGYWPGPLVEPVQWMPVTGWVLSQTDLRIAHFIGLHQMQFLPAAAALGAWMHWRPAGARIAIAFIALVSFAAVLLLQG